MNNENKDQAPLPPGELPEELNPADNTEQLIAFNTQQITDNPQPATLNTQTLTDMEVHHHSHEHHGKKTWKHYFWEFLMLFLAVFCGFMAEWKLEHVIENSREKQYIQSLIADLKSDQEVLKQHIKNTKGSILMLDTMTAILNDSGDISQHTNDLYYLARLAPRWQPLSTNNRTFEQLKNSGNFRLIRKMEASNKIMAYYEKFPQVKMLESMNETEFTEYKKIAAKVFEPAVFLKMQGNKDEILRSTDNPPLRNNDKETLKELSVFAVYMNGTKTGIINADEELIQSGAALISYLETAYRLE